MPRVKDTVSKRDNKGRILKKGISQRKDGRYILRITIDGEHLKPVYDWDLKRLERKAEEIRADYIRTHVLNSPDMSLNSWFGKYMEYRRLTGMGEVAAKGMEDYYNWYVRDTPIGKKRLYKMEKLTLLKFFVYLQEREEHPLSYGTVKRISNIIENVLDEAVAQQIIQSNVAHKITRDIPEIKLQKERNALSVEEVHKFMDYVKNHWAFKNLYNILVVMFGLGLRAGEVCALTEDDVFEDHLLVYKTLHYRAVKGKRERFIGTTKTAAGKRSLPYPDFVKAAIKNQKEKIKKDIYRGSEIIPVKYAKGKNDLEESYTNFFFYTNEGTAYTPEYLTILIKRIVNSYNRDEKKAALSEKRDAKEMELFSAHICRHTFATRASECGLEQNHVSKWLGHSLIDGSRVTNKYIHSNWKEGYKELEEDLPNLNKIQLTGEK